jgi:hypothetical protein
MESSLREYGPTPFPAYDLAVVTGMRAENAAHLLNTLDPTERAQLIELLRDGTPLDTPEEEPSTEPLSSDTSSDGEAVTDEPPEGHSSRDQEMARHVILQQIAAARRTRPGLAPRK